MERPPRLVHPARSALLLAAGYLLIAVPYILFSDRLAERFARSEGELAELQTLKGVAFMVITGAALFGYSWVILRRIRDGELRQLMHARLLVDSERRAVSAALASSVAHDINNNLTVALSTAHALRKERGEGPALEQLELALRNIGGLTARMVTLGHDPSHELEEPVELVGLAETTIEYARLHPELRTKAMQTRIVGPPTVVRGHRGSLEQAIFNLILNAAQAVSAGGRIEIRVGTVNHEPYLEVCDDGPGIPPERRQRVLDPFETTKSSGRGLGLFSVASTARLLGGRLAILDADLGGACLRLVFPRSPDETRVATCV